MAKKRNKRRHPATQTSSSPAPAASPAVKATPQPAKKEYKSLSVEEISPEAWALAQEYLDMCEIGGMARVTGSQAKREQKFRERISKLPQYRQFSSALVRLQRGEQPPS